MTTAAAFTSFGSKKTASLTTVEEVITISTTSDLRISYIECICDVPWLADYVAGQAAGDMIPVAANQPFILSLRDGISVVLYAKLAIGTGTLRIFPVTDASGISGGGGGSSEGGGATLTTLLNGVLVTGASSSMVLSGGPLSYQGYVAGTGAVTATFAIQVSNDPDNLGWVTVDQIVLSGTTNATDAACIAPSGWAYARANLTAISGTGAAATLIMGN